LLALPTSPVFGRKLPEFRAHRIIDLHPPGLVGLYLFERQSQKGKRCVNSFVGRRRIWPRSLAKHHLTVIVSRTSWRR